MRLVPNIFFFSKMLGGQVVQLQSEKAVKWYNYTAN